MELLEKLTGFQLVKKLYLYQYINIKLNYIIMGTWLGPWACMSAVGKREICDPPGTEPRLPLISLARSPVPILPSCRLSDNVILRWQVVTTGFLLTVSMSVYPWRNSIPRHPPDSVWFLEKKKTVQKGRTGYPRGITVRLYSSPPNSTAPPLRPLPHPTALETDVLTLLSHIHGPSAGGRRSGRLTAETRVQNLLRYRWDDE
jgi:hypothetical protein